MIEPADIERRFYRDGPDWPTSPQKNAAERYYRVAFLEAAREAATWPVPDNLAIAKAWAERRKARRDAEASIDGGIVTYRRGHEIEAAQTRGRVHGFEFVRQCFEALKDAGMDEKRIGPLVIQPWVEHVARWAGREIDPNVIHPPPRPEDCLTKDQRRMLEQNISPGDPRKAQAVIRSLANVTREFLDWLWPGRIPLGKLTLLAGDPGLGKSFVTLDIAARVSRGEAWPDMPLFKTTAGGVVLFNAEDDLADTIAPRLDKMNADDTRILAVEGIGGRDPQTNEEWKRPFSLETDLPRLDEVIADNPDTRLVIIDPISAFTGKVDSHKNADVRLLLAPLADLAGRHQVSVLSVTHLSKSGATKAVYRAMGSLAFAAAARAVWAVTKDPNDPQRRLFLPAKLNLAQNPDGLAYRIEDGRVLWDVEPVRMHADDAFAAEVRAADERGNKGTERREAVAWIREQLANGPVPSSQIIEDAKENGFAERTLRRAYKEMGGRSEKEACQWVWSLPGQDGQQGCQQDGH